MFKEGEDYYYDTNGLMALTVLYLKKRGYCCGKGCLNCPYEYENVKNPELKARLLKQQKA